MKHFCNRDVYTTYYINMANNMTEKSVYIIAEAGVNHNGNRDLAFRLVDAAVAAGADAVKFQTFRSESVVTKHAAKAEYQKKSFERKESQLDMLRQLELPFEIFLDLKTYCDRKGITFLSTAFDDASLAFLVDVLKLETLKIPSGEITNGPFLLAHAKTKKNLIVSTGMATLGEIETALGVIAYSLINRSISIHKPAFSDFEQAFSSAEGQEALRNGVTLLHCTSEYPAPPSDVSLRTLELLIMSFGLETGFSDHSSGIWAPIAAVAMGASLIEKHFTLDKELPGPDHKASLDPDELTAMVSGIRIVEQSLGDGLKILRPSERGNRIVARRSLVAAKKIRKGEMFTAENVTAKRPGHGTSPMQYWEILGQPALQDYDEDDLI